MDTVGISAREFRELISPVYSVSGRVLSSTGKNSIAVYKKIHTNGASQ
jgi:hypothetical protein